MEYGHNTWVQRKNTGQGMPLHKVKLKKKFILCYLDGGKEEWYDR